MEVSVSEPKSPVPVTVLSVHGEVTAENYEQLQQQAESAHAAGARNLILDLAGVTFLSSSGLRAIHHIFMLFSRNSGGNGDEEIRQGLRAGTYKSPHLKLAGADRHVLPALKMAGFDMFLDVYPDVQHAIAAFRTAGASASA